MKVGPLELTRLEYAVWLGTCAGKGDKRIAGDAGRSIAGVRKARRTLCRKLGIDGRDVPAIVRAAASADLLKHLPPLKVAKSCHALNSKHEPWTPSCQ